MRWCARCRTCVSARTHVGQGLRTLVPRVLGQTAEAQQRKGRSEARQWDEQSFFQEFLEKRGPEEARVARQIVDWARDKLPRFTWGRGMKDGSFTPVLDQDAKPYWPLTVYTYGRVEILFQYLTRPPFDDVTKRQQFLDRLNAMPGVTISADALSRRPSIPLSTLTNPDSLKGFFESLDWCVSEVRAAKLSSGGVS